MDSIVFYLCLRNWKFDQFAESEHKDSFSVCLKASFQLQKRLSDQGVYRFELQQLPFFFHL